MEIKRPENFGSPEGIAWLVSRVAAVIVALLILIAAMNSFVVIQPGYSGMPQVTGNATPFIDLRSNKSTE